MVLIPKDSIEDFIQVKIESQSIIEYPRSHIGYSELGESCSRKIWYSFRWCKLKETSARVKRLLSRGDWEEERIVTDLGRIGIITNDRQKEVAGLAGHIFGHIDGILTNIPGIEDEKVLAEFKTANQKRFDNFVKFGVKRAESSYYYQSQSYMGKLNIKKCLFVITNKNDENRYMELVDFNETDFEKIESKALDILTTDNPPSRIGPSTWYECKFCRFRDICHFKGKILKSCRTCQYCVIKDNGVFYCNKFDHNLTIQQQKDACNYYIKLKELGND